MKRTLPLDSYNLADLCNAFLCFLGNGLIYDNQVGSRFSWDSQVYCPIYVALQHSKTLETTASLFEWHRAPPTHPTPPGSLVDGRVDSKSIRFLTAVVRASLGSHVGKPSSAYGWSGGFSPRFSGFHPPFMNSWLDISEIYS